MVKMIINGVEIVFHLDEVDIATLKDIAAMLDGVHEMADARQTAHVKGREYEKYHTCEVCRDFGNFMVNLESMYKMVLAEYDRRERPEYCNDATD